MTSRKFLSLFLICALVPLGAAQLSLSQGWFNSHSVNKGTWVEHELALLPSAQATTAPWRLVYFAPEDCPQNCAQALYALQQLYTGLGRKQVNLQPLVITKSTPSLLNQFSALEWSPLSAQQQPVQDSLHNQMVIVNREGMALLRYPVEADSESINRMTKNIRTDLLRLMNYDRSGS